MSLSLLIAFTGTAGFILLPLFLSWPGGGRSDR